MAIRTEITANPKEEASPTPVRSANVRPATAQPAGLGLTLVINPPAMAETVVRVAALADLHCTKTSQGAFQPLFARIAESADLLLMAGDLTDYGLPEEARVLAKELTALRIPVAAVLGNHDFESGKADEVRADSRRRRAATCSTATPASCRASASPASRDSAAGSASARSVRGARRSSSSSSAKRSTKR